MTPTLPGAGEAAVAEGAADWYQHTATPDMEGAVALAAMSDKYLFQDWAVIQAGGHPAGGERKKGADKGVDGVISFVDGSTPRRGIISVKAGATGPLHVRELAGTINADPDAAPLASLSHFTNQPNR